MEILLVSVIALALLFDFTNGFHDTANAIATSVATRAVSPKIAVIGAAVLNFVGAFVSLSVAATIATGIVASNAITLPVVLAGIVAATIWNLLTWRVGLPSSSSHALVGGIAGSAVVATSWEVVKWDGLRDKVLVPSLIAPILGFAVAWLIMHVVLRMTQNRPNGTNEHIFRRLQLISGSFVAFTHGTNDAQKTMGIIALALMAGGAGKAFEIPLWVIVSSATAMAAGTYFGGWRIIQTLGHKLVKLEPSQGFAAEVTTASILGATAHFGFPVSTTHTISGSIMGAGTVGSKSKVRWSVAKDILIAWLITIPCSAAIGAGMQLVVGLPMGSAIVTGFAIFITVVILATHKLTWESTAQIRSHLDFLQYRRK
jgi:PiT family inorganic phosphate transporter